MNKKLWNYAPTQMYFQILMLKQNKFVFQQMTNTVDCFLWKFHKLLWDCVEY